MSTFRQLAFAFGSVVCLVLAVNATTPPASKIAPAGVFDLDSDPISSSSRLEKRVVVESDGWRLVGELRIPRASRPMSAVILLNKANGDRKVYVELAQRLADRGIASLRIDLRGHGESINKGKFVPFQENSTDILKDTDKDIVSVIEYLSSVKGIDAKRIGVVGASYSGEEMAVAGRQRGYAKAYVALSPG
ncbi:MAG: alpha/beta hydrolase, partial [Pyrinomonadaceae bacterium]